MLSERALFTQWQAASQNSDISPTQLNQMVALYAGEWDRARNHLRRRGGSSVDLTRTIHYRGFALNTLVIDPNNDIQGCEVTRVDYPGVGGVGYDEKRALEDGYDASDTYLGKRFVALTGNIYGRSRGEFFDLVQALTTALTPTAAYQESPGDKGFLPLDYYVATANLIDFPAGYIHKMMLVKPSRQPSLIFEADKTGGLDTKALALPWTGLLEAKDPRVYFFTPTIIAISDTAGSGSGNLVNKGDYPAPLNILLIATAGTPSGNWHFIGGGADLTIPSTPRRTSRYSGTAPGRRCCRWRSTASRACGWTC